MRKTMRGVTLMELMVVVVIVGILTAIAYPSYRQYAARAKRNEARAALLQIATRQESFYLQNNTYTEDMQVLGFDLSDNWPTDTGSYTIDVDPGANSNGYTARAVAVATVVGPTEFGKCALFTIDGTGAKASTPDLDCWTKTR